MVECHCQLEWKEGRTVMRAASGPYPTVHQSRLAAYTIAFKSDMPYPSIRRHWWQIWRKKYSADEIEVIDRAWKEVSDD